MVMIVCYSMDRKVGADNNLTLATMFCQSDILEARSGKLPWRSFEVWGSEDGGIACAYF